MNEAGIGRRAKQPLAAELGPGERCPFPAYAMELLWGSAAMSCSQMVFWVSPPAVSFEPLNSKNLNWN